ncbi:putative uncharacterized protein DDB_G0277255 [Copidosoma floridanum]|uniref:putative uncharacterized protein DDB_G0277255 n=1 Tax=Copidosoma floridanum TaxID=29053 RepID=UPI0006C94F2A|nr:putative uncharacterized protein DDB_G0277255 [Copidosoma floridanum]
MFGTKIRSWMEAHLPRSRGKRSATGKEQPARVKPPDFGLPQRHFDPASFFAGARAELNEILPSLAISSFKPDVSRRECREQPTLGGRQLPRAPPPAAPVAQQPRHENGKVVVAGSAVNLSSPESAYSTGYSTDGTSPCATYAPECYIRARDHQQQALRAGGQGYSRRDQGWDDQLQGHDAGPGTTTRTSRCGRQRRDLKEVHQQQLIHQPKVGDRNQQINGTGTYTVSTGNNNRRGGSYVVGTGTEESEHQWRKPAPPTSSRPLANSPKIHSPVHHQQQQLMRKPYSSPMLGDSTPSSPSSPVPSGYPLQLFSPRRMPLVATTTTQVTPVRSPRQRSRLRTSPWPSPNNFGRSVVIPTAGNNQQQPRSAWTARQSSAYDYCCRQESLSVGRSPVNRSDWPPRYHNQHQQTNRSRTSRSSSASSCSSRSCSVSSSSSNNNSPSNASSCSSDITLNEVMGRFEENYVYKETDIVSDHSGPEYNNNNNNNSSSVNFSSDASASSLDLLQQHFDNHSSGRSSTGHSRRQLRGMGCPRRQRRRRHRRISLDSRDEEDEDNEQREEVEVLQEMLNRRLKKNKSEVSAQTNRALLERLLMKNSGFEGRRAWSANPPLSRAAASRSLGGTPICLRRRTSPRHVLSPPSRLGFDRRRQVHPVESTGSLKNVSASELALIEADKEADLKYAQLIMEAERMLLSAKEELERDEPSNPWSSSGSVAVDKCSPISRFPRRAYQQPTCTGIAPNKRVELIKNAELHIELALSKSRNSQPELSSGSIKDLLDHSSPKRLQQQQQKKINEPVVVVPAAYSCPVDEAMDFKSLDVSLPMVPRHADVPTSTGACLAELSSDPYSCPQSEPVKRKVYEANPAEPGALAHRQAAASWLRNSDTDCTADQQQQLQLQSASAASSYAQLKKHVLIETLQGLKQSLEDQSAALKFSCLRPL